MKGFGDGELGVASLESGKHALNGRGTIVEALRLADVVLSDHVAGGQLRLHVLYIINRPFDEVQGPSEGGGFGKGLVEWGLAFAACIEEVGGVTGGFGNTNVVGMYDGGKVLIPTMVLLGVETLSETGREDMV